MAVDILPEKLMISVFSVAARAEASESASAISPISRRASESDAFALFAWAMASLEAAERPLTLSRASDRFASTLSIWVETFAFDASNTVYGKNFSEDFSEFDVICGGEPYAKVRLGVIGRHNALNALAACAVAWKFGISGEDAKTALASFHGAGRRLEYKGSYRGADVYDDYAHHPNELHALLQAVRLMHYQRVICAFQPHTYSRTRALFQDFVDELRTVDQAVLTDIYAAREQNTVGVSSADLAAEIPGSVYCPSLQSVTAYLQANARPGDIILTVGAGDIYKAGEALLKL